MFDNSSRVDNCVDSKVANHCKIVFVLSGQVTVLEVGEADTDWPRLWLAGCSPVLVRVYHTDGLTNQRPDILDQ